jgi:hypothetical protein
MHKTHINFFILHILLCCTCYKIVIFAFATTNCIILYKYVIPRFNQLHGHPRAIKTHDITITIAIFILDEKRISVLLDNT